MAASKDFTLPTIEQLNKAIARDLVDAFGKNDLAAVYARGTAIAPRLYPAKQRLTAVDLDRATDLLADAFLLLGLKQ